MNAPEPNCAQMIWVDPTLVRYTVYGEGQRMSAKAPHVGEELYLDKEGTRAVQVVRVEGTSVWVVPLSTTVRGTHQGNLYDADGNRPYRV
jgi:hypothetical protein